MKSSAWRSRSTQIVCTNGICRVIGIMLICLTVSCTLAACGNSDATKTATEAENGAAEEAKQEVATEPEQEANGREAETGKVPANESSRLSAAEVEREVNAIASGTERSMAKVEAKQDAIRKVRERACK